MTDTTTVNATPAKPQPLSLLNRLGGKSATTNNAAPNAQTTTYVSFIGLDFSTPLCFILLWNSTQTTSPTYPPTKSASSCSYCFRNGRTCSTQESALQEGTQEDKKANTEHACYCRSTRQRDGRLPSRCRSVGALILRGPFRSSHALLFLCIAVVDYPTSADNIILQVLLSYLSIFACYLSLGLM